MKKNKNRLFVFVLASVLLTGCNSTSVVDNTNTEEVVADVETDDKTVDETEKESVISESVGTEQLKFSVKLPTGAFFQAVELTEVEELSEEEAQTMDRAMRAYVTGSSPVINNAKNFYYYSQLDIEVQYIYDALSMLAQDPGDEYNIVTFVTMDDPASDEFFYKIAKAYFALVYDHPEMFWLYNESETSLSYGWLAGENNLINTVYFYFANPVDSFQSQQKKFNLAVEDFMKEIDLDASERDIAKEIHDKLIEMVSYDTDLLEMDPAEGAKSLSHTAYGALVENSDGVENCAVCDGYSLAYTYLLQQAGLDAVFIGGIAGDDKNSASGHAWSMVKINGDWVEVDATWDDMGTLDEAITEDIDGYEYLEEALSDADYREKLQHYLWAVTTSQIEDYSPGEDYYYYTKDGKYMFSLVSDSIHIRDKENTAGPMGAVIELAPIAN